MKEKSYENFGLASSEGSPKDALQEALDEHEQIPEPKGDTNVKVEFTDPPVEVKQPLEEKAPEENPIHLQPFFGENAAEKDVIANDVSPESHGEGEDGWQPVQRPRSGRLYGRRLRQRRAAMNKVYTYQKKDVLSEQDYSRTRSANQNSKYQMLKKQLLSPGTYVEYHSAKSPYQGTKFGRRIVKAVAYRVKSVSSAKDSTTEKSKIGTEEDARPVSAEKEVIPVSMKSSIVSLGKSPSYKEVALAPPGTISLLQVRVSQDDFPDKNELIVRDEETTGAEDKECDIVVESTDHSKVETITVTKPEETYSTVRNEHEQPKVVPSTVEMAHSSTTENNQVKQESTESTEKDLSSSFEDKDHSHSSLKEIEDSDKNPSGPCFIDTREVPNKKLSALAAPYNPSPTTTRVPTLPMNVVLPSGPGAVPAVAPWPMNMTLHPGPTVTPLCPTPHHPYPSPPPTPNMIHSLRFVYPSPYTHSQPLPTSNFPVTSSPFHPNHFAWQHSTSPNTPEYIQGPVWPVCQPVEFSVPAPVVEPIAEPFLESKEESNKVNCSSGLNLSVNVDVTNHTKPVENFQALDVGENLNAGVEPRTMREDIKPDLHGVQCSEPSIDDSNNPNKNAGSSGDNHIPSNRRRFDNEKTFNILIRGRKNRKQTLRMPISLLSRPHNSKSFKVIYSRVIRESEAPKSTSFSSDDKSTPATM